MIVIYLLMYETLWEALSKMNLEEVFDKVLF